MGSVIEGNETHNSREAKAQQVKTKVCAMRKRGEQKNKNKE